MGDVIQFRRSNVVTTPGKPELVFDPDTELWSIVLDGVEVYRDLDPKGRRRAAENGGDTRG